MMKIRNQKGFTLLEIMLVVLIIGIIALLALPRLLVTRKMARQHTCEGSQSALRTHLEAYKWDWGVYPGASNSSETWLIFLNNTDYWPLGDPAPRYCPSSAEYVYDDSVGTVLTLYKPDGTAYAGSDEYTLYCPVADHNPAGGF
jgi:prepilin-type N-terminal cleavage/methylation domain-containing protein